MMLDMHSEMLLNEYREKLPIYEKMKTVVLGLLRTYLDEKHIIVSGLEARVKSDQSFTP